METNVDWCSCHKEWVNSHNEAKTWEKDGMVSPSKHARTEEKHFHETVLSVHSSVFPGCSPWFRGLAACLSFCEDHGAMNEEVA